MTKNLNRKDDQSHGLAAARKGTKHAAASLWEQLRRLFGAGSLSRFCFLFVFVGVSL